MGKLDYLSKYTDKEEKQKKKKKQHKDKDKTRKSKDEILVQDEEQGFDRYVYPVNQNEEEDEEDLPTIVRVEDSGAPTTFKPKQEWAEVEQVAQRKRRRYDSDDEELPLKVQEADYEPRRESIRRNRHESEEEAPSRKREDSDDESYRKRRYDSEDDHTQRHRYDSDDETQPRKRYDSDDKAPPGGRRHSEDGTRPRRRYDSDDKPTKGGRYGSDDKSPKRKRYDSDVSDDSRVRKRYDSEDERARPPNGAGRNERVERESSRGRKRYDSEDDDNSRQERKRVKRQESDEDEPDSREKMSSGHVAGLQQAGDFRSAEQVIQQRKKQEAQAMVDKHGMGETVYRDDFGRQVEETQKKKLPQMNEEEQAQLNKGKVQKEKEIRVREQFQALQQSSFARHADDGGLEESRKDVIRKGDPMAAYALKKKAKTQAAMGKPQRPSYKGPPPKPNRYGIPPGYRWDGVDRGNGFEDKVLASKYSANHKKEQAYRWSTSDM